MAHDEFLKGGSFDHLPNAAKFAYDHGVPMKLRQTSRANLWLWRYHEQVLEQLRTDYKLDSDELADLRIPASSPLLYRFPSSAIAPD